MGQGRVLAVLRPSPASPRLLLPAPFVVFPLDDVVVDRRRPGVLVLPLAPRVLGGRRFLRALPPALLALPVIARGAVIAILAAVFVAAAIVDVAAVFSPSVLPELFPVAAFVREGEREIGRLRNEAKRKGQ